MSAESRSKAKAKAKSRVNEAGNYTKPGLRKQIFNRIKQAAKAENLANGLRVKRRCWPLNTSAEVEVIQANAT